MNRLARRGFVIATAIALLSTAVACSSGSGSKTPDAKAPVPGVTDKEILFGATCR